VRNVDLRNLYASPNVIRVMKSRWVIWAGHVADMGEVRNAYKVWSENLKGKEHSQDLGVDGRIILDWITEKWGERVCTGCVWLRIQTSGGYHFLLCCHFRFFISPIHVCSFLCPSLGYRCTKLKYVELSLPQPVKGDKIKLRFTTSRQVLLLCWPHGAESLRN
jgi:hypothetical protein